MATKPTYSELKQRVRELEDESCQKIKAELKLQKAYDELELLVEKRTAELAHVNEELRLEIEEREVAQWEHKNQSEFLKLAIDSLEHPFLIIDASNYRVQLANAAACEEEFSENITCYELTHRNDRPCKLHEHACPLEAVKKTKEPVSVQHIHYDERGSLRNIEIHASPIVDEKGDVVRMIEYCLDVTDREKAEQEKRELEAKLTQSQKMEAVGTLAGGIAHDFNNLLMAIQGNASLMLFDIDPTHPHHELLSGIKNQVESGASLTAQLLGYARKGKYYVQPVQVNHMVEDMATSFGRTRKDISIRKELAQELPPIDADRNQLQQVLLNLLINASEAMPRGGELILKTRSVTDKAMQGKVYHPKPGHYVLLTVSDTGKGMDQETLGRIFEPFFTTKEMGRGTGLGLASSYGIVKSHGGFMEAESELGKRTTLSVYLPATDKVLQPSVQAPPTLVGGSETILLVDDEDRILKVGTKVLEKLGYRVLEATNGVEALKLYKEQMDQIDLVILDLMMPQMGGAETFDRLKEINPDVKVLLSTGYSLEGLAEDLLASGCDAFIQKPFGMQAMAEKIREVLGEKGGKTLGFDMGPP